MSIIFVPSMYISIIHVFTLFVFFLQSGPFTVLGVAACYNHVSVLEVLLKYGAEINKKDRVSSINLTVNAVMLKNFFTVHTMARLHVNKKICMRKLVNVMSPLGALVAFQNALG